MALIDENVKYYIDLVECIKFNKKEYQIYENQYKNLLKKEQDISRVTNGAFVSVKKYRQIEIDECTKIKLSPARDFTIRILAKYSSPQGRNTYQRTFSFHCKNVEELINEYQKQEEYKQSK